MALDNKVGICVLEGTLEAVDLAVAAKADYCELPAWSMLMGIDDDEFSALEKSLASAGANVETCNLFIPPGMRLNGPDRQFDVITKHIDTVMERMRRLGVQVVGFGSGPARDLDPEIPVEKAMDELEEVFRYAADRGADTGIVVALEPLRRFETNIFNTLLDGANFIREREITNLRLMADNLHMMTHYEPFGNIREVQDLLVHVHLSDNARIPNGFGRWEIWPFLSELDSINYSGRCSIEVFWNDMSEQAAESVEYVRRTMAEVNSGKLGGGEQ